MILVMRIILILTFFFSLYGSGFAQNIRYKLFRPTIVQVFNSFDDKSINEGMNALVRESLIDMADAMNIPTPEIENVGISELSNTTKEYIGLWFDRDKNGYMSDKNLKIHAGNTAAFEDILINDQSEISRLSAIADDLIPKSYLIVFELSGLEDYKMVYDREERSGEPVVRKFFGFMLRYSVKIYKIDWNENTRNDFYNNYYVDSIFDATRNHEEQVIEKQQRITRFENLNIPVKLIYSHSLFAESSRDVYMSYELEQSAYYRRLTKPLLDPKTKSPIPVDFNKKGQEALKSKNFLAAELCFKEALKSDPKNKDLQQMVVNAHKEVISLFKQKEQDNFKNQVLVGQLKSEFKSLIKNRTRDVVSDDFRLSDDFKVATTVAETTLTKVKLPIGTKEGLQVGDRYVAYELVEENGSLSTNYVGYCRATKKMAQNVGRVSGYSLNSGQLDKEFLPYNSTYSIFVQQAGKKLTPGMILEFEPDNGKSIFFTYDWFNDISKRNLPDRTNGYFGSIVFGYGFSLRKAYEFFGSKKMGPQNLFMNLQFHYFNNKDLVNQMKNEFEFFGNKWGIPYGIGLNIEREIYTGCRGLYISPFVYGGLPIIGNCGFNLGYNLNKHFSISVKKQFIYSSLGLNLKYRI